MSRSRAGKYRSLGAISLCFAGFFWNSTACAHVQSVHVGFGPLIYQISGQRGTSGTAPQMFALDWAVHHYDSSATVLGYRRAVGVDGRVRAQVFSGGYRVFPLNVSFAHQVPLATGVLKYDFRVSPFAELSGVAGRYLVESLSTPADANTPDSQQVLLYDLAADFVGITPGLGLLVQVTTGWTVEFAAKLGILTGLNAPFQFSATDQSILLGLSYSWGNSRFETNPAGAAT